MRKIEIFIKYSGIFFCFLSLYLFFNPNDSKEYFNCQTVQFEEEETLLHAVANSIRETEYCHLHKQPILYTELATWLARVSDYFTSNMVIIADNIRDNSPDEVAEAAEKKSITYFDSQEGFYCDCSKKIIFQNEYKTYNAYVFYTLYQEDDEDDEDNSVSIHIKKYEFF